MKSIVIYLLMALSLTTQTTYAAEFERAAGPAFKGFELYSWKRSDGTWLYSLLPGTNRNKTKNEIVASSIADVSTLKRRLAALAVNERVFWSTLAGELSIPDAGTVAEIKAYCASVQIDLHVAQ
jgi:hypothetical protein